MAVVVENSADQVEAYTKGNGVFPVSPEVLADNAAQAAKRGETNDKHTEKAAADAETKVVPSADAVSVDKGKGQEAEDDDKEGEDGLTPRQKREFTKAMQATIGKKHRMQREAEEFAAAQYNDRKLADQRADKLAADLEALKAQLAPKVEDTTKEPARTDYKDDQEYWDAMVDFRVDKKLRAEQAAQAKREADAFVAESAAHAQAKMDRALELGPENFKEVYESADIVLPNYVLDAIKESDLMPELVYFLGENREKAEKIKGLTDGLRPGSPQFVKAAQRQLVEIGKIESTLKPFSKEKADNASEASQTNGTKPSQETGSAPSKPRVTAPIIRPLNGGSASQADKDEGDKSTSEVITSWQKKHGVSLTARKRH